MNVILNLKSIKLFKKIKKILFFLLIYFVFISPIKIFSFPKILKLNKLSFSKFQYFKNKDFKTELKLDEENINKDESEEDLLELPFSMISKEALEIINLIKENELKKIEGELNLKSKYILEFWSKFDDLEKEALIDIVLMQFLLDNNIFKEEDLFKVKNHIIKSVKIFSGKEKEKYTKNYNSLLIESHLFSTTSKKGAICSPENIIFLKNKLELNDAAICYDGNIFLSISDFFSIFNSELQYMENSAVIAVNMFEHGLLEFEKGKKEVYLNDKLNTIDAPILDFVGKTYAPCSSFLELCGLNYVYIPYIPAIIVF